jgi:hypothetical protein
VLATVAAALTLASSPDQSLTQARIHHLRPPQTRLDDCEHVLAAALAVQHDLI